MSKHQWFFTILGMSVSLALSCFVVYSTGRSVLSLACCYFVFVFFSPLSIGITGTPLGGERANLSVFRTIVQFARVWYCLFPLPPGV